MGGARWRNCIVKRILHLSRRKTPAIEACEIFWVSGVAMTMKAFLFIAASPRIWNLRFVLSLRSLKTSRLSDFARMGPISFTASLNARCTHHHDDA